MISRSQTVSNYANLVCNKLKKESVQSTTYSTETCFCLIPKAAPSHYLKKFYFINISKQPELLTHTTNPKKFHKSQISRAKITTSNAYT